jgi:hypothetical protein
MRSIVSPGQPDLEKARQLLRRLRFIERQNESMGMEKGLTAKYGYVVCQREVEIFHV